MTIPTQPLTGQTKNGAIVGEFLHDMQMYAITCGCGRAFHMSHERTRVAIKKPTHMLHCYNCLCKLRAKIARASAIARYNKE